MKILIFHPTVLPPRDYGGVERVVLWLARGLLERGHEVYVAALRGSLLPRGCQLVEVDERNYSTEELKKIFPPGIDLVHFMAPLSQEKWDRLPVPSLLTVHGNAQPGEKYPKNSVFLSKNHAERHQAKVFVYNGIDPAEYTFAPSLKEDWYLFLSKTSWRVKNLKGAMNYCSIARVPLKIAGGNRPLSLRLQCLYRRNMKWVGPVGGHKKSDLLARAKALIFPVLWPEPFGLVVAEALISGTPVIASARGSLPELIPPEVGGLAHSDEEWVDLLRKGVSAWSPESCRDWAMKKFHYSRMAADYEHIYQEVMRGGMLHVENPIGGNWRATIS